MSNGIGPNPLNAISKVYLDQIVEKKKDDTYLEPDMKKRQANNEKARKELAKGPQMKNPHFEENQQGWESVNALADAYKEMQEGIRDEDPEKGTAERKARLEKKRGMKLDDHPEYKKEEVENVDEMIDPKGAARIDAAKKKKKVDVFAYDRKLQAQGKLKGKKLPPPPTNESLDPVGKEDGDINNDGKKDSTDSYLMKRRKAIGKAMKKRMAEQEEKIGGGNLKKLAGKATKRIDADVDGDVDTDDPKSKEMGEFVPSADGKRKVKPTAKFESYSWRQDLSEVMTDDIDSKPIKEKKVNNKIKINPKLGEAIEEIGGTLIEQIEIDEMDYVIESVYNELIEEGFSEDDVEFGIESALNTLDEGYYDSAVKASKDAAVKIKGEPPKKSLKDRVKSAAKKAIFGAGRAVGQAAKAKAAVQAAPGKAKSAMRAKIDRVKKLAKTGYKSGRGTVEKKSTAYRGAGAGRKEKVAEAVYGGTPPEKKDTRMTVTAADKKGNTPAYQRYKAGDKRYKAAGHMDEEMSPQELALQKKKAMLDKMIANRRKQELDKGKAPTKAMGEGLSVDDQMRISRDYNRKSPEEKKAANMKAMGNVKKVAAKKDTRTDAQKMTDATGPRPGSRYRGD